MDNELSMVLLRDTSQIQKQAYNQELLKAFSNLVNQKVSQILDETPDAKYIAIRISRNLEINVVLSVYDKKKLVKTSSFGCKYQNGSFESHKGGWMTSKTPRFVVSLIEDYQVEEKKNPKFGNIPWDTSNDYRLILEDSKNSVFLGLYSNEEYDLTKVLYNLKHLKISQEYFVPGLKLSLERLKFELPKLMKAQYADMFLTHVMASNSFAKAFKEKGNAQYQSFLKDSDNLAQKSTNSPERPKIPKMDMIDSKFDLSSVDSDYQTSNIGFQGDQSDFAYTRKGSEIKIKSDFTKKGVQVEATAEKDKMTKSILKHPDQGGSHISNFYGETSMYRKPKSVKIDENSFHDGKSFRYESMIARPTHHVDNPKLENHELISESKLKPSTTTRQMQPTEVSTVIAVHIKKNQEEYKPQPEPPSTDLHQKENSIISPTSMSSSPSSISPGLRSLQRSSPRLTKPQKKPNSYFSKEGLTLYSTQIAESQVNSRYKERKYFDTDVGNLSKASMLGENKLVDAKFTFNEREIFAKDGEKRLSESFTLISLQLPLNTNSDNLILELYTFGMFVGNSSQIENQTLDIKKVLIKEVNLKNRTKCMIPELNRNNIELHEKVVLENGFTDFIELVLLTSNPRVVLGSSLLHHELFAKLISNDIPYTAAIDLNGDCAALNLVVSEIANNRERKIKTCCDATVKYVLNRTKNLKMPEILDKFIEISIKQRKIEEIETVMNSYLPPNVYLCLWLLITKKFKPKDKAENKEQENIVKFKSSILQSLYLSKREASSIEVNNRVSLYFHKMLQDIERRAEIANSTLEASFGRVLDQNKGEYFKSTLNRFKIIDYIFTKIMCDYFNMFVDDSMGAKNVLFSRNFRSFSRDYMLLHNFVNNYCENILKLSLTSARDLVIWIIDHILSVNIGILREPLGYYHINFLFLQSMRHKDDPTNSYGWRINLYLHVYILSELETLLNRRLNNYLEMNYSLEYLYNLVTSEDSFYPKFKTAYLNFEPSIAKIASQTSSSIQSFIKSISTDVEESPLAKAERIYQHMNANKELRKLFEANVLENIMVYQLSRINEKPHKLINCVKVSKQETTRKVALMVHKVYNKDCEEDEVFFTLCCDGVEYEQRTQNCFYFSKMGHYSPAVEVRIHKIGDDLLFKKNDTLIGSVLLQLRRFKANVLQRVLLAISDNTSGKQYFLSLSVLVQEVEFAKEQLQYHDDNTHFKALGNLGFLLMGDFKHPISNFEDLIVKKISNMYEELAMEIDDQMLHSKFYASMITGARIRSNLKDQGLDPKVLKLAEKQEFQSMDSFSLTLKILLFKKNFELLEDYIVRYFGSDANSISAAELVYTMQGLLKIIDLRWHLLETVRYLERILKKPLSPKLESFVVFLGVKPQGFQAAAHIDLLRAMNELLSYLSFKKNCGSLAFGDCHDLFLIKDVVEKMRLKHHMTDNNFLSIRFSVGEQTVSETVHFDRNFKTDAQKEVDSSQVELEEVLASHQYILDTTPLDFVRISKMDLRKIFTHVPLIEYLRFTTQSIKN
jgi:hypothetical protein